MHPRFLKHGLTLLSVLLIFTALALADTCNNFATYTCAHGTPNVARPMGGAASGQSIGFILTGTNQFSVVTTNGVSADDVILIGASVSPLTGTVNGMSFTSLSSFPEGGALGAIGGSLEGLGFCTSPCHSLAYGYVDLQSALAAGGSLKVIEQGVPVGTALYAMLIVNGNVKFITPNSE